MIHGQGARVPPKANIRTIGWLKQLKVAIWELGQVCQENKVHKIRETNFVDLH
jgi:hypothetical protein